MNLYGWIFMSVSWAVILGLFGFCLSRTLRPNKNKENQDRDTHEPANTRP